MRPYIEYRHGNDPDRDDLESDLAAIHYFEPTETIQDAPDTDINVLVKRFGIKDGSTLPGRDFDVTDPRFYGDWDDALTHRQVLDLDRNARERFEHLPAGIRAKFNNDPYALWPWINNPDNAEEAIKLGLLKRSPGAAAPVPPAPPPRDGGETTPD